RGRLTPAEEIAVYLDAALAILFIGTLLVFIAGPTALVVPTTASIAALAYPTGFIGLGIAGLIAALAVGYPLSSRGALPLIGGAIIIGLAYLSWIAPVINL